MINNKINIIQDYVLNNLNEVNLEKNGFNINSEDLNIYKVLLNLLKGEDNITFEPLKEFIKPSSKDIVYLRWNAIQCILKNEYIIAEELLLSALEIAKTKRIDRWIVRDIYLDLRNLEYYINNNNYGYNSKYQQKLTSMSKWNYRPFIDSNLKNSFYGFITENFNNQTDSPATIRFGGNFSESMENIAEAFKIAILNGSYTLIRVLREQLAYSLYNFGTLHNETKLIFNSLKLFMIEGKTKNAEKIITSNWDVIYKEVIDDPSSLLELSFINQKKTEYIALKCMIIKKFGAYFMQEDVHKINLYLKNYLIYEAESLDNRNDIQKNVINSYKDIINRLDKDETNEVIDAMLLLFERNNEWINEELLKTFSYIDWKKVLRFDIKQISEQIYYKFKDSDYKSNLFQIINNIKKVYPNEIIDIEFDMLNTWNQNKSLAINSYFSYASLSNIYKSEMIADLIERINHKNNSLEKGSSIGYGGYSLFHILSNHLIKENRFEELNIGIMYEKVLLNPYQSAHEKFNCIDSIIRLIKNNISFEKFIENEKFIKRINFKTVIASKSDSVMMPYQKDRLEIKLLEFFVLNKLNEKNVNEMIAKCIEYGMHPFMKVREDTVELIKAILKIYDSIYYNEVLQFLYSKTFDNGSKIRGESIYQLNKLASEAPSWKNIIYNRTVELIDDSDSYVRSSIIQAFNENSKKLLKYDKYNSIFSVLKRDKHYKLRLQASENNS